MRTQKHHKFVSPCGTRYMLGREFSIGLRDTAKDDPERELRRALRRPTANTPLNTLDTKGQTP